MPTDDAPPSRLLRRPSWLLGEASLHAHRWLTEALSTAGSRGYDYRVLAALEEFGPESQARLGRRTGIDRSDVVASVDGLVDRGLATRTRDDRDRRQNVIAITTSGRTHLRHLDGLLDGVQDRLLAPLDASERRRLVELLRRVVVAAGG